MFPSTFNEDYEKKMRQSKKLMDQIMFGVQQRSEMINNNENTSTLETQLRGNISKLDKYIREMQEQIKEWSQDPESYSMTEREVQKRKNDVNQLKNRLSEQKTVMDSVKSQNVQDWQNDLFNERNQNVPQKPTAQEQYQQDLQIQVGYKDKLQKQDQQIDNANQLVLGVKGVAQEMNKELVEQDVVIGDLTENVDKANAQLAKTNRKLTFLVKKSSNLCLAIIILLEIAALICILVFL